MRSQKQVRRVGKVRSLKNAAAGKWKIYRKCLEARKAWQNNAILTGHHHSSNTLVPPKPTRRRMKEPKQRSAEELAERQRLREQRHLEKKLAKQRASTSTLPETRKKKKLEEGFGNGSPKKASAGHKTTTKTTKIKNSMMKDTTKAKRLMNEQVQRAVNMVEQEIAAIKLNKLKAMKVPKLRTESIPKRQYLMSTQEQEINQSSSPTKLEQKELVQSKKTANGGEQNDIHGSAGRVKGTSKEQMRKKNRRSVPNLLEHDFVGITKQEGDISEKEKIKELNKSIVYLAMDQNCTEESKEFKAEKIMDHITPSSGKIPKHSETLWKTKMVMKTSFPKELDINMGKLAQQYSEPLGDPNLSLSGNASGSMTAISCVKEAKYDMNVEKKSVLISQTDEVNRVPPVRDRICKLLPRDIQFCVHMIEKHGEDYEAMEKDQGNIFRDSTKGIARKIRIFKESPQYEAYLKKKTESFGSVA